MSKKKSCSVWDTMDLGLIAAHGNSWDAVKDTAKALAGSG